MSEAPVTRQNQTTALPASVQVLAIALSLFGVGRLVLLVATLASRFPPGWVAWWFGVPQGAYLANSRVILTYTALGLFPIALGLGILRRRRWVRTWAPPLAASALFLDLHFLAFGYGAFSIRSIGDRLFSAWQFGVQLGAALVLLMAALLAIRVHQRNAKQSDSAAAPPSRFSRYVRSAALLLIVVGLCQMLLPALEAGTGPTWFDPRLSWRFSLTGDSYNYRVTMGMILSAVIGVAMVFAGGSLSRNRSWAWISALVVCGTGVWMLVGEYTLWSAREAAAIASSSGVGGVLGLTYAAVLLAIAVVIAANPPKPVRPRTTAAATPIDARAEMLSDVPDGDGWHTALMTSLSNTGVTLPATSRWRRIMAFVLLVAVGGSNLAVAQFLLPQMVASEPAWVRYTVIAIWYATGLLVVSPVIYAIRRVMMATRAKNAIDELSRAHGRRPILYLRSFEIDEAASQPPILELLGILRDAPTPEQKLAKMLGRAGPVIAIGRPGEKLPQLGAARFYVADELWKQKVADVAKASQLVVWTTGVSNGLRWEISHLLRTTALGKLLLWAHPHLVASGRANREAEWSLFNTTLGRLFPKPFPHPLAGTELCVFAPDGNPVAVEPKLTRFGRLMRPFTGALTASLQAVLASRQANLLT
jgi:hypothetical protein